MNTHLLDQARQLSLEEQLQLVEALWDSIAERNAVPLPRTPKGRSSIAGSLTTKRILMTWFPGVT